MFLTATQVIVIELVILIIHFCFKETQRVNVTKENKEKGKLSEHKNQKARLPKQIRKEKPKAKVWTEGRKRKKQNVITSNITHFPWVKEQNQKATLLNNQVKRKQAKCQDPKFHRSSTPKTKTVNTQRILHTSLSLKTKSQNVRYRYTTTNTRKYSLN